ncbi:E3 ubiquitin-protein ligase AIRP2-like isoform X2 [Actinidia eriantha]|uniref:E3 ubiquitin-protein ligase AIRP2-like isoform X2 n=1 Tax=Actinidia eriantha TaxID=165200 RepID=UPI00258AAE61|nr:E3 ubiquitin-protein ligase AIRP2-like isoform X2 [Actinidia eriantha]
MAMRKSFKDSLKALEADIQHANTLALGYPRQKDGACLQMRLSYSPVAHLFLFLVQWADCQLAGTFGLLRVLIYMTYADGKTTMSVHERKASIREFYDLDDRKQREICLLRYSRKDDLDKGKLTEIDIEREEECGICMEMNSKVVLPNCSHSLCMTCYWDWHGRSQSCPFCRDSLKQVNSGDLWVCISNNEITDLSIILRENLQRLFMYIEKLPLIIPDHMFVPYDSRLK